MTQKSKPRFPKMTEAQIWEANRERISEIAKEYPECVGVPLFYFDGKNSFLSNFEHSPIELRGFKFANGEAAFQGFKDMSRTAEFENLTPSEAKRLGRQVSLRPDWEQVKYGVMYEVVYSKFSQNDDLKDKLLATGNRLLVEGNWWNDKIWGVSRNKGENHLGIILMRVRDELRN